MRLPVLFVLLAAATAAADPPKPPAKVTSAAGQIWRVEIDCDAGKEAVWYPGFADEDCFVDELKPLRPNTLRLIVQPKRAGVFRVGLLTVGERQFSTLVIDAGPAPAPPPTPIPPGPAPGPDDNGPKPPPTPVVPQAYYVVVVEETGLAVAERGAFFADAALAARMQEKGHKFRVVDQNVVGPDGRPPADVARFLSAAAGKTLPRAFLVDQKGKAVWSGDLPKTPAALAELLQKYGG